MARKPHKGNRISEGFLALPYSVLNSPLFTALQPHALKLLLDVAAQYRGDNNGDLSMAWKLMKLRGWRSEATLNKAKWPLIEAGFLYETRKGYRPNTCSLYALTWCNLDASDKYDMGAKAAFVRGEYRFKAPLTVISSTPKNEGLTPRAVAAGPTQRHAA